MWALEVSETSVWPARRRPEGTVVSVNTIVVNSVHENSEVVESDVSSTESV